MHRALVDLHIHSTCSDGFLSPEEVVERATELGLRAIALADHDNIDGIGRAIRAAGQGPVEVLAGVELSSQWRSFNDLHLLGYAFDYTAPSLVAELATFQQFREQRSIRIVERINGKLDQEGKAPLDAAAIRRSAGGTVGRPHIARALRSAGYASSNDEAFDRYLIPCNVEKRYFPADQAIDLIHRHGGVAVLAHPTYLSRERSQLTALIDELIGLGLDGLEAYNNGVGQEGIDWLIGFARKRGLLVTGGSDFHGDPGATIEIGSGAHGHQVPYSCVEEIYAALARRQSVLG